MMNGLDSLGLTQEHFDMMCGMMLKEIAEATAEVAFDDIKEQHGVDATGIKADDPFGPTEVYIETLCNNGKTIKTSLVQVSQRMVERNIEKMEAMKEAINKAEKENAPERN